MPCLDLTMVNRVSQVAREPTTSSHVSFDPRRRRANRFAKQGVQKNEPPGGGSLAVGMDYTPGHSFGLSLAATFVAQLQVPVAPPVPAVSAVRVQVTVLPTT